MIEVKNLSKNFKIHKKEPGLLGSLKSLVKREWIEKKALQDIDFKINEGEVVGLIGSNGAGKTTLAKILSGIIHPGQGSVSVIGFNPWERDNEYRSQMSLIMGQKASLWWDLPAYDCYLLLKEIYQIPDDLFEQRLEELATHLDIKDQLKVQVRRLSLGERMKVELIAALLHAPKVIFLDEPTIGLDLTAQKAVRSFLKAYRKKYNPIMIITSHYMEDIKELCERIIILKEGQMIYDGDLEKVLSLYANEKNITAKVEHQEIELAYKFTHEQGLLKFNCPKDEVPSTISKLLSEYKVQDLSIEEIDISDIIEKMIREGVTC